MKFDKILVLAQNMLGDVILVSGVLKALRTQFPKSKIGLLCAPFAVDIMQLSFIDEVIPYAKGMPLLKVFRQCYGYDIALCLDFKYRSAWIPFFSFVPVRAGINHKRGLFMSHGVDREPLHYKRYEPEDWAYVLEQAIGLHLDDRDALSRTFIADATENDKSDVNVFLSSYSEKKQDEMFVGISAFTSTYIKDWPIEKYEKLLELIRNKYNARFILFGAKNDKKKEFPLGSDDIDARGELKLTASAELMRRCDIFISSCSALLHVAGAIGLPTVALYGPTAPSEWAPKHKCRVVSALPLSKDDCRHPCDEIGYGKPCDGKSYCMKNIAVDNVMKEFELLVNKYL